MFSQAKEKEEIKTRKRRANPLGQHGFLQQRKNSLPLTVSLG
jgi:hypothetical protein